MSFIFRKVKIPGILIIEPKIHKDERGFFVEAYKESDFSKAGISAPFVQDNFSVSAYGVIRGLHYQKEPFAQGRLIRVTKGRAFDIALDLRPQSESFGQYYSMELNAENMQLLWVPEGFAHGFMALEDGTELLYKATKEYSPEHEAGIRWDDPSLKLPWPKLKAGAIVSAKDRALPFFNPQDFK